MGIKAIVFKLAALCSNLCQLTVCMIDLDLLTFKGINWGGGMYLRLDSLTSGLGPPAPIAAHSVLPFARTPAIDRPDNSFPHCQDPASFVFPTPCFWTPVYWRVMTG